MTGIKIAGATLAASGVSMATIAQIDVKPLLDAGDKLGKMSVEQILGTLCLISILAVIYLIYKVFAILIPTIMANTKASEGWTMALNAHTEEIKKCHEKNR